MKIILSRKGFDSASGGVASPILPDGSLLTLPIPDPSGTVSFGEFRPHGVNLAQVAHDLTRGRLSADTRVHLDPDLEASSLARLDGWRPAFGQCSAAQGHLERFNVGVGDLFLFSSSAGSNGSSCRAYEGLWRAGEATRGTWYCHEA